MAGSGSPQPKKPNPPKPAAEAPKKPLQVLHISRRETQKVDEKTSAIASSEVTNANIPNAEVNKSSGTNNEGLKGSPKSNASNKIFEKLSERTDLDEKGIEGLTMADLIGPSDQNNNYRSSPVKKSFRDQDQEFISRSVDDFDFDEDAFLAALDENEPIGNTGEIAKGKVIAAESDGVYVDIGGKAPGFMPKSECGLGVITNIKERFPTGLEVEVLVTREQNADGMVTISCRALALRKSWDKVTELAKEGKVVQIKINGFNRGGVTCDLEGLRGFIPRSQLQDGSDHESQVGKTIGVAFLEVNPDTRKLVLSEKKAAIAVRFAELEVGQLVEGQVAAIKPYGYFIDLGGVSGLLHQSVVTGGSLRSLKEVFVQGDLVKALITELDPGRGRIGLNTALLESQPGELLVEKETVMAEAAERAQKARNTLKREEEKQE